MSTETLKAEMNAEFDALVAKHAAATGTDCERIKESLADMVQFFQDCGKRWAGAGHIEREFGYASAGNWLIALMKSPLLVGTGKAST